MESNFRLWVVVTCAIPGVVTNSISSPSSLKNPLSRATSTGRSWTAFIMATFGFATVSSLVMKFLRLGQFRDAACGPREFEDVHACVCPVDDVDIATVIDFDIIRLNRDLALL